MSEKEINKKLSRWWGVLLIAVAFAIFSFLRQWTVPFVVSAAVALIAFIVIDWINSSGGTGSTPTIYGC